MEIAKLNFSDRDEFKRKAIAEKVITLLASGIDVSPMVIDGGWGTGKTEFCFKLINLIKTQNSHELIYVDAFQADHADEPMLTVLAEVIKLLPTPEAKVAFTKKIIPAARYGLKTIAKSAIAHLLKQDTDSIAEGFDKEIQQVADKAIDSTVESLLKDHVDASKNLLTLQNTLKELAQKKPIIIFIDELDRCRPSFAVDMLEIIKHVFDVEGVSFVLITNTQQLKASINHCYGNTVDAQRYLDKFLKFSISIPQLLTDSYAKKSSVSIKHFENLVRNSKIISNLDIGSQHDHCHDVVSRAIMENRLSLREVERLIRHIEIYQVLTDGKGLHNNVTWGYRILRLLGIMLFCFKPEIAKSFSNNSADAKELGKFLNCHSLVIYNNDSPRPEAYEIAMTVIGRECRYNSELFLTKDEIANQLWDKLINNFFGGNLYMLGTNSLSIIFTDAIDMFSLNS